MHAISSLIICLITSGKIWTFSLTNAKRTVSIYQFFDISWPFLPGDVVLSHISKYMCSTSLYIVLKDASWKEDDLKKKDCVNIFIRCGDIAKKTKFDLWPGSTWPWPWKQELEYILNLRHRRFFVFLQYLRNE